MDDPAIDPVAHRQALRGLARLNAASGASGSLWSGVRQLVDQPSPNAEPLRVLDVASGGGDIARGLWRRARRAGYALQVHGVDFSPTAVEHASTLVREGEGVSFEVADVLAGELPAGFDIVTCSLFMHHLTDPQCVELLKKLAAAARRGIVISDLRRSRIGYALAVGACRTLSRSPVVWTDGPRSVEGAFTPQEFGELASRAGLVNFRVEAAWPQRFIAVWRKASE